MKMNKKLVVPFLSSVIGLSIAGGLGGAFAWYQFNSQVRTGFIGTSVADTGLLQIGYDDGSGHIIWGRDRFLPNTSLKPVTFGELNSDGTLKTHAYGYPESGKQNGNDYTTGWTEIQNGSGFYQYDIYLRALKADPEALGDATNNINPGYKLVAQDVYMSQLTLEDSNGGADALIVDAVRVHLNVKDGRKDLLSKNEISASEPLNLYGQLDLDGDGQADKYEAFPWESNYDQVLTYGINGETQVTKAASSLVQARDSEGKMPATPNEKLICTTKTGTEMTKITITVWLEGWALLKYGNTDAKSNIWNPHMNAGMDVRVGMIFDVGNNILG